jgi:uncharacterized protein (TIGR03085 family)
MTLARTERAALADLLVELGPDQPTLCDGWTTADLLVHLQVRERRPDAVLGMFLPPLAGWMAKVSAGYRQRPWDEQIEALRSGPPSYSPLGWGPVDDKANSMEMFIHHEDARRGQPDWQPRELDADTRAQLIPMSTSFLALRSLRKVGIPVTARLTDEPGATPRPIVLVQGKTREAVGEPAGGVVISGGIADLLLWLSGRSAVHLEFEGDPASVAAVQACERGV